MEHINIICQEPVNTFGHAISFDLSDNNQTDYVTSAVLNVVSL